MAEAVLELDISSALDSIGSISDAFDVTSSDFGDSISAALDAALSSVTDIGDALDAAGANFGDSLAGATADVGAGAEGGVASLGETFQKVGDAAVKMGAGVDVAESASKGLEATTGVLSGRMGELIRNVAPQAAIFAGVTAAVVGLVDIGDKAILSQERMKDVFGSAAPSVLGQRVGDLDRSLGQLNEQTGVSDTKMRMVLATFGQTAIGAGATQKGAADVAREMGSLAGIVTTLNPALGTADQNFTMISRGLGGSTRILQRYGITIDSAKQSQLALSLANDAGRQTASLYDKQVAGLTLSMQFLNDQSTAAGTTLNERLNKAVDSSSNQFRKLKGDISTALEGIAVPLVQAGLQIAQALTPIATSLISIFGGAAKLVIEALTPIAGVLGDIAPEISIIVAAAVGLKVVVSAFHAISDAIDTVHMVATFLTVDLAGMIAGFQKAYEAAKAFFLQVEAGEAEATLGISLLIAGLIAIGVALFTSSDEAQKHAEESAKKWMQSTVESAKATGHEWASLKETQDNLQTGIKNITAAQKASDEERNKSTGQGRIQTAEQLDNARQIDDSLRNQKARLVDITAELDKHQKALAAGKKAAQDFADAHGIAIPQAIQSGSKKEVAAFTKVMQESTTIFGAENAKQLASLGETTAGFKALNSETTQLQGTVSTAMGNFTNVFSTFQSQTDDNKKSLEELFTTSITQSVDWSTEMQGTVGRFTAKFAEMGPEATTAVQHVLQQLESMGPAGKPALDAFNQMTDQHGEEWVAGWASQGEEARTAMVNNIAQMQFDVENRLQELRNQAAIAHAGMVAALTPEIVIKLNADDAVSKVGALQDSLNALVSRGYNVDITGAGGGAQGNSSSLGGYHPSYHSGASGEPEGFYATGGLVPGALGQAQLAVVHGGENVQTVAQQAQQAELTAALKALAAWRAMPTQRGGDEYHFHGIEKATDAVDEFSWHSKTSGF